jgi:hypothetical protein
MKEPKYKFWGSILLLIPFLMATALVGHYSVLHATIISPIPDNYSPSSIPLVIQVAYEEQTDIKTMIRNTFKKHTEKAFRLLECENTNLNPNAININKDKSRDVGIFQISTKYQKVQEKFLLNPKINIAIAYQLFVENGNRFNLWTCGKKLDI